MEEDMYDAMGFEIARLVYVDTKATIFALNSEELRAFKEGDLTVKIDILLTSNIGIKTVEVPCDKQLITSDAQTDICMEEEPAVMEQSRNIDKETFLKEIQLGPDDSHFFGTSRALTRSQSCGDLVNSCMEKTRRKQPKPKFLTPSKLPLLNFPQELAKNQSFVEKIAETINEVRDEVAPNELEEEVLQTIVEKAQSDPLILGMAETLANFDLQMFLKPSANVKKPMEKKLKKTNPKGRKRNSIEFKTRLMPNISYAPVDEKYCTERRVRPILPRPEIPSIYPVIVCQPIVPPPEKTPAATALTMKTHNQSQSTPRRNHIRVLEFETPEKGIDEKQWVSCPKEMVPPQKEKVSKAVENGKCEKAGKSWDSDLRVLVPAADSLDRKKVTGNANGVRKKRESSIASPTRITRSKTIISPSKMGGTSKRSTFAISEDEVALDAAPNIPLKTPAKPDDAPTKPPEETPFTKLLRENVTNFDTIDLSLLNTPFFPATPGVHVTTTPQHEPKNTDYSSGSSYYKPDVASPTFSLNRDTPAKEKSPENTKKKIEKIVTQAKSIIEARKESGKNISFLKMHMIAQCDKKLVDNIVEAEKEEVPTEKVVSSTPKRKRSKSPQEESRKLKLPKQSFDELREFVLDNLDAKEFSNLPFMVKKHLTTCKKILAKKETIDFLEGKTSKLELSEVVQKLGRNAYKWLKNPKMDLEPETYEKVQNYKKDFDRLFGKKKAKSKGLGMLYDSYVKDNKGDESSLDSESSEKRPVIEENKPLPQLQGVNVEQFLSKVYQQ